MCAVTDAKGGNDGTKGLSDCHISGADAWLGKTVSGAADCPDNCIYAEISGAKKCYATCPIFATCAGNTGCEIHSNDCYEDCSGNNYVIREGAQDCTDTGCSWVGGKCRKTCVA